MSEKFDDLKFFFNGLAGRIEGIFHNSGDSSGPVAIFLPPAPDYGGTYDNEIIRKTALVFNKCGISTLRINYRGVGLSEGSFANPSDAVSDAFIALDSIEDYLPFASHFWVVGYSFGAWVATNVIIRRPEVENFVLISPIFSKSDFSFICPSLCDGLVIIGENDEFTTIEKFNSVLTDMNEGNRFLVNSCIIPEAGHLYKSKIQDLEDSIENYVNTALALRVNKPIRKKRRKRQKKDRFVD